MVVTHTFISCFASLLYWVLSKVLHTKTNGGSKTHDSYFLYGKYLKKNSFIPSPHWIKLENFVMQLKMQSVEARQNEKHYSKGNNTSENPIPRHEISNQSTMWSTKGRSGHNICCLCSYLLELSSCRVTYENCYKSTVFFSIKSEVTGWIYKNSNGFELRNSYFTTA